MEKERLRFTDTSITIKIKDALKNYMDSYIKVYLKECGTYPQVAVDMTEEPFFSSDAFPATEEYPNFIIIGMYGKVDASLCVDIVTGKVYSWDLCEDTYEFQNEGRFKAPELLADSLTELFLRLLPFRK